MADFNEVKNSPATTIHNKKASGTDLEESILDRAEFCVANMRDFIHSYYKNTPFADEFDLTSRVIIVGIRHNIVNIHLLDANTELPVTTGTATKTKWKIVGNTDANGIVNFDTCASGIQDFHIEAPGYIAQDLCVKIESASVTELIVKLKKL